MEKKKIIYKTIPLLIAPFIVIYIYGTYFGPHKNELMRLCELSELKNIDKIENYAEKNEILWTTIDREIKRQDNKEMILSFAHGDGTFKEGRLRQQLKRQGVEAPLKLCPALRELVR